MKCSANVSWRTCTRDAVRDGLCTQHYEVERKKRQQAFQVQQAGKRAARAARIESALVAVQEYAENLQDGDRRVILRLCREALG